MRWNRWGGAALVLALAAAGCDPAEDAGGEADGVSRLKRALPAAEEMTIHMPSAAQLAPEQATFYGFTRGITLVVNGFVWQITHLVEDVVASPPTETDGESFAIWGPYADALSPAVWRVRVDRAGDGVFDFRVDGWPKADGEGAAVTVLEGTHDEGAGRGDWTYHLTAAHGLDPIANDSTGDVAVAYALGAERTLEVRLDGVQGPHDPMAGSSLYRYTEAADGAGTFDFISNLDVHAEDDPALDRRELLRVRSRWLPTGPGRADVVATHGDLPAGEQVDVVECWDDGFLRSYVRFGYAGMAHEEGDAAACPFDDRQAPAFEGFDADAFADADLVDALPGPVDLGEVPEPVADPVARPSAYYTLVRDTVRGLVTHVGGALELVRTVTRHPPGDCTPAGCSWGPYTDWNTRVSFRLAVTREGEAHYAFRGESKRFGAPEDAWRTTMEGGFVRTEGDDGRGWLEFDFDAAAAADPNVAERGAYRAEWSREGDHRELAVRLAGLVTADEPRPTDARYFVEVDADGGRLDVRFPTNIDQAPEKAAREEFEGRFRWTPEGAGAGNASFAGGDLTEGWAALGVECWDERAAATHTHTVLRAPDQDTVPNIDADRCAFADWQAPEFPLMGDEL